MTKTVVTKFENLVEVNVPDNATEEDIKQAAKLIIDDPYGNNFWGDLMQFEILN